MTLRTQKLFKTAKATRRARGSLYGMTLVLASVLVHLGFFHEPEASPDTLVASGQFLARFGALDAAWENAERALDDDPNHLGGQLLKAHVQTLRGELNEAISTYENAHHHTRDRALRLQIMLYVADLQRRCGQFDSVFNTLSVVERVHGATLGIHRMRGLTAWDRNQLDAALHQFRLMRQMDPGDAEAAALEARIQIELTQLSAARTTLTTAPKKDSDDIRAAWRRLIRVALEKGMTNLARESVHFCLRDDPETVTWLKKDEFWSQHAGDLSIEEVLK